MTNRAYKNIEMFGEVKDPKNLATKEYVDNSLNARLMQGVKVAILDDLNATYNSVDKTLTQNIGSELIIDGITLELDDEVLYVGDNTTDKTQCGIYKVTTLGTNGTPSVATLGIGSNTGIVTLSDISIDKAIFEAGVGLGLLSTKIYTFTYSGTDSKWKLDGNDADLSTYGITIASETPQDGDTITVDYTLAVGGTPAVLTRAERMDSSSKLFSGCLIPIYMGTVYGDSIFQLVTENPMVLDTTSLIFEKYKGQEQKLDKFEGDFVGNDVDKEFTITHGLGTKNVEVDIYDNATGEKCMFGIEIISENAIKVLSDVVLTTSDKFDIVIIG